MQVIGLDLGGTKLASARFDDSGAVTDKRVTRLGGRGGAEAGQLIVEQLRSHLESGEAVAAGVSVPGIYYTESGRVWAPNIDGWEEFPLLETLREAFGDSLALAIDNDRACYILGESWKGAARGCSDAIYMAVGTGIGAGILSGGRIVRGASDIAGSVGWMALSKPYKVQYDACGCFEFHSSGGGIAALARSYLRDGLVDEGVLALIDPDKITASDVFRACEENDPLAVRITRESIEYWGMAAANLISIFNPEKLIFGGGVFGPAVRYLDRIRAEAERWAQPVSFRQAEILASGLGGEAGLIGAGRLALMKAGAGQRP